MVKQKQHFFFNIDMHFTTNLYANAHQGKQQNQKKGNKKSKREKKGVCVGGGGRQANKQDKNPIFTSTFS